MIWNALYINPGGVGLSTAGRYINPGAVGLYTAGRYINPGGGVGIIYCR